MKKYKFYIVFLLIIGAGLSALMLISLGYYPIALVNNHFISAKTFLKDYGAASIYYDNVLKTYRSDASRDKVLQPSNLQRSVLTQLVENTLIEAEARRIVGPDFDRLVGEKVDQAGNDPRLEKAAQALYGLNLGDFKKEILLPQAERDVLTGRLYLEDKKIDNWLQNAKKSGRVIIFSGQFYWNGDTVEAK